LNSNVLTYLENYNGATLILCKTSPKELTVQSREFEVMHVVGGFSRSAWKDGGIYHGDKESYIFSCNPKFRNFRHSDKGDNFQYLNTTFGATSRGIGFGGSHKNDFRLWVDGSEGKNGFVTKSDSTYEGGELLDDKHSTFRVFKFKIN
jgi:hypothetical protein